jgi:lipopolysaccharide/colanic/teichoic acid biosynthesis glycosyltransferase
MYIVLKRATDISLSLLGIISLFPLGVVISLLILMESKKPVFYVQNRVGKGGKIFKMYKFRSMVNGAERHSGPVWAKENDPRITPIGRIIRKTRIDELPQLFNVLKGEMSMVGPRPERPEFVATLRQEIPDYTERLKLKPGLTGLAQVNHRYDTCLEDVKLKLARDLEYLEKQNLSIDFKILTKTIGVVLTGKGAH